MDGMVVAHCDWGKDPKKRWMAVASRPPGGDFTAAATVMVGNTATLLDRLRGIAGPRPVLIGFDFPIGVPKAYADAAGIAFTTTQVGSMFGLFFSPGPIGGYADVMACDVERFKRFFHAMLAGGVYLAPSAFEAGFVSARHGDAELQQTRTAAREAFRAL